MSKFLVNLFMLNTKAVVNAWTFTTLPFYTIYQQPWKKLRLSKSFGVQAIKDRQGRTVYSRPCPVKVYHPLMTYQTLNEVIPHLDPKRRAVGYREVLSEEPQLDERGQPIKIDGKELKKIKLADDYQWWNVEQVLERVDALARGLQAMGVTEKSKVLIYADNSFDWFCAGLAVGRLNAITVTLLSILSRFLLAKELSVPITFKPNRFTQMTRASCMGATRVRRPSSSPRRSCSPV